MNYIFEKKLINIEFNIIFCALFNDILLDKYTILTNLFKKKFLKIKSLTFLLATVKIEKAVFKTSGFGSIPGLLKFYTKQILAQIVFKKILNSCSTFYYLVGMKQTEKALYHQAATFLKAVPIVLSSSSRDNYF